MDQKIHRQIDVSSSIGEEAIASCTCISHITSGMLMLTKDYSASNMETARSNLGNAEKKKYPSEDLGMVEIKLGQTVKTK